CVQLRGACPWRDGAFVIARFLNAQARLQAVSPRRLIAQTNPAFVHMVVDQGREGKSGLRRDDILVDCLRPGIGGDRVAVTAIPVSAAQGEDQPLNKRARVETFLQPEFPAGRAQKRARAQFYLQLAPAGAVKTGKLGKSVFRTSEIGVENSQPRPP